MSLSRRDFLKASSATAAGVATGGGLDLAPVEAAATSLQIKEAKAFAGVCPYCAVGCGQLDLRQGRQDHRHRGQPGHAAHARPALPQGCGDHPALQQPAAADQGALPGAGLGPVGGEAHRLDVRADRQAVLRHPREALHRAGEGQGRQSSSPSIAWTAIASLGSACIDNEECYLLSKLNRTLGIVYHEHQARV